MNETQFTEYDLRLILLSLDFLYEKKQMLYTMQPGLHGKDFLAKIADVRKKIANAVHYPDVNTSSQ